MPSGFFGRAAILGIGVVIESNIPQVLEAALGVFPDCNDGGAASTAQPVYIVLKADHGTPSLTRENRVCGKQLHIADDGISLQADGERGHASCSLRIDVIGSELFRETINTAVLFLATQQGRIPVHASAIVIGECAFVLAGRSGSGKSTLAHAANRLGVAVLAEDTVFVQLEPIFRIWGLADHIHVYAKDAPGDVAMRTRLRSGRIKQVFPVKNARQSADKAVLCVIARGDRVLLDPLPLDDAVCMLIRELEPGYDLFATRMEDAIRAIGAGGCWRLTLSQDPATAIIALIEAFDEKAERQSG